MLTCAADRAAQRYRSTEVPTTVTVSGNKEASKRDIAISRRADVLTQTPVVTPLTEDPLRTSPIPV
jgi:hypothetical protein